MAYSQKLAAQIRKSLAHLPNVEEKKMFGGLAFMVNGKMCITTGADRIMCRIDPNLYKEVIKRKGCHSVIMRGREYKGYVYISVEATHKKKDFNYWISLALVFNRTIAAVGTTET